MTAGTGVSPVAARPRLLGTPVAEAGLRRATARMRIGAAEPVFAGHYPDFPIFPGVCLVECVLLSIRLVAPEEGARLAHVESARFLSPVFAEDQVDVELELSEKDGAVSCRAEVRTDRGTAAVVRLRYPGGEPE